MIKRNKNRLFLSVAFLAILFSLTARAIVPDYITVSGPQNIAVGKTGVEYSVVPHISGIYYFLFCFFCACDDQLICVGENDPLRQQLHLYLNAPTHECVVWIEATFSYDDANHVGHSLCLDQSIDVQKPHLQTARTGLNGTVYENSNTAVPIHWNIDDDDRSGFGVASPNISYGEDYRQYEFLTENGVDDDLYCIQACVTNVDFNASGCNLKIKTPDSMRLWYTQNKSALCCDSNSVFETNCNIVDWFNTHANSPGNRLYVEWVVPPNTTTNEYIEFYCNGVQFAKLRYKGYAISNPAYINMPIKLERTFFEGFCELDGCEWGINRQGSLRDPSRNSIAEAVDPHWSRYGEPFVATKTSPVCPDIYTLRNGAYSNFVCRCMSMDTFNNQNYLFEEADATAFFTIMYFWTYNYLDIDLHGALGDIVYYSGPFAATRVPSYWLTNCRPSWDIFTSRFFNQPKIVHNPYQLESTRTILDTYVIELP